MDCTKGKWEAGYNPGVTGPTTPAFPSPICGGVDWPYRTVNVGMETIAIVPAQDLMRTHTPDIKEAEANANLIAAAPDMYKALWGMVKTWEELHPDLHPNMAKLALAKAEGKEKGREK